MAPQRPLQDTPLPIVRSPGAGQGDRESVEDDTQSGLSLYLFFLSRGGLRN